MESLGQKLKKAREAKGLTVEEMVKITKISERNVISIESDRFDNLPAPTYIKGFLKLYSQSVGLDTREVLDEFQRGQVSETKQILILEGEQVDSLAPWSFFLTFLKRIDPKFWAGLGFVIVLIFVVFKSLQTHPVDETVSIKQESGRLNQPDSSLIRPQGVSTLVSPTEKVVQSSGFQGGSVADPGFRESLILVGRVRQPVWLRVHCDDRLVFEGTLKKGDQETWHANEFFRLRIGNPDAIALTLNGKDLGRVGSSGKIRDVRLTKDGWYIRD